MGRIGLRSCLLFFLLILASGCSSFRGTDFFSAGVEVWDPDLDGDVMFSVAGITGTDIDLGEVLAVDGESVSVFRGALDLGPFLVDLKYLDTSFSGDTTLGQEIVFNGQTFTLSSDVSTNLDVLIASSYFLFPIDFPGFSIAPLIGVSYLDFEAEIASTAPVALSISDKIDIPVPVFGLAVATELSLSPGVTLFLEGEFAGLVGDYESIDGKFIDATVIAGLRIAKFLRFGAGYRLFDVAFDEDSGDASEATLSLDGVFFFGEVVF